MRKRLGKQPWLDRDGSGMDVMPSDRVVRNWSGRLSVFAGEIENLREKIEEDAREIRERDKRIDDLEQQLAVHKRKFTKLVDRRRRTAWPVRQ